MPMFLRRPGAGARDTSPYSPAHGLAVAWPRSPQAGPAGGVPQTSAVPSSEERRAAAVPRKRHPCSAKPGAGRPTISWPRTPSQTRKPSHPWTRLPGGGRSEKARPLHPTRCAHRPAFAVANPLGGVPDLNPVIRSYRYPRLRTHPAVRGVAAQFPSSPRRAQAVQFGPARTSPNADRVASSAPRTGPGPSGGGSH